MSCDCPFAIACGFVTRGMDTTEAECEEIQEETGAKVSFNDRDGSRDSTEDRTVTIRGKTEDAQKAELMIRKIIADMPTIITEEVEVPAYCLGRIIGRGGENIRVTSRASRCKIYIDRTQDSQGPNDPRVVSITGSKEQIQLAKTMIEEKVMEEEQFRAKTAASAGNREQRRPTKRRAEDRPEDRPSLPSKVVEPEGSWDANSSKTLVPEYALAKEFMEVFVSAVEHPGHFWVQIITSESLRLDKMTDDMTAFYSNEDTAQTYAVASVKPGDLVAAPFELDKAWYRARVLGLVDGSVDLYFIDFGDNGLVPLEELRELQLEYQSLPVQAIECKLANVKPTGESWSDEACETFETLVHCAQWKILSAHTVGYEPSASGQMPCLQLFDNSSQAKPVDVALELVEGGLALWEVPPGAAAVATETVRPGLDPKPA